MAVTADTYQPFDAGAGSAVAESGWRAMARHWLSSGVLVTGLPFASWDAQLKVTAGIGLQVSVASGEAWINGHHGVWTGSNNLAVSANASGSTRTDFVVARADFVNNVIELDIVEGTPGAGAPTLTTSSSEWEIPLATYTVADGASAPTAITDRRLFSGAPPSPIEVRLRRASVQSAPGSASSTIQWDTEDSDAAGFIAVTGDTLTVPTGAGGLYVITAVISNSGVSGQVLLPGVQFLSEPGSPNIYPANSGGGTQGVVGVTVVRRIDDAATIRVFYSNTGSTGNFTASLTMARLGL